jgi:thioredoxin-related protein
MFARPSVLFAVALTFAPAAIVAQEGGAAPAAEWLQNFADAKAKAAAAGKDLLVDFTGSDWCVWCQRLDAEVFEKADFQAEITKNFVLVKLDYPQNQELVTAEIKAQNAELQAKYKVQGFPTIFLMDAEGKPYAQTGYQEGGDAKYLEHVSGMRSNKVGRDEHFGKAKDAKGIDRATHLAAGLEALKNDEMVLAHYRAEIDEVMSLDADGKAGLKGKFEAKVAKAELEGKFQELAQAGDWDGVDKLMAEMLEKFKGNGELEQMATFYRAVVLIESKQDFDGALKLVDAALAFAPESDMGKQLPRIRKNIEKIQKQSQGGDEEKKDGGK